VAIDRFFQAREPSAGHLTSSLTATAPCIRELQVTSAPVTDGSGEMPLAARKPNGTCTTVPVDSRIVPNSATETRLLDLPDELLRVVFSHLTDHRDLKAVACTSRFPPPPFSILLFVLLTLNRPAERGN